MPLWRFEHHSEPLAHRRVFLRRVAAHGGMAALVAAAALAAGACGYRLTEGMGWLDAALNASMILSGMGPVSELHTEAGKLFATLYALFSGVVFLAVTAVVLAPVAHRLMHRLHLEEEPEP